MSPQNSYVEALILSVTVFAEGALREVIKVKSNRTDVLIRVVRDTRVAHAPKKGHMRT